jgi:palmitoyl transferase
LSLNDIFSFFHFFIQLAFIPQGAAEDKGWFATFKDNVSETWQQPEHYDLYIPAITWHARFAYDKEKRIATMNARGGRIWSIPLG